MIKLFILTGLYLSFFLFLCVFISLVVTDRVLLTSILSVLSFSMNTFE